MKLKYPNKFWVEPAVLHLGNQPPKQKQLKHVFLFCMYIGHSLQGFKISPQKQ